MKQMIKYTFAIVTMLLVSLGAKADGKITVNGTVVYDVQGTSQNAYTSTEGTVSASIDNSRLVTLLQQLLLVICLTKYLFYLRRQEMLEPQ